MNKHLFIQEKMPFPRNSETQQFADLKLQLGIQSACSIPACVGTAMGKRKNKDPMK